MFIRKVLMKNFSGIVFWSIVFAIIFVFSVVAKCIFMPEDSIVNFAVKGLGMPEQTIYLFVIGLIALLAGSILKSR